MASLDTVPSGAARGGNGGVATSGSWAWILQRVSAFLLIVFIGAHWWISHFDALGDTITFAGVQTRLQSAVLVFVDGAMLIIVLYHALNGVRNVLLDFNIGRRAERALSIFLLFVGIAFFIYGLNALLPFTVGTALFYR